MDNSYKSLNEVNQLVIRGRWFYQNLDEVTKRLKYILVKKINIYGLKSQFHYMRETYKVIFVHQNK